MDLMKIGLYGLAGFGAYAAYEHFSKKGAAASVSNVPPITTDEATSSFTGTNWQQAGRNRETMWQNGGVFSNAAGGGRVLPTGMERSGYLSVRPRPTGFDGRTRQPNASNQWLAAIPGRTRQPNASNQWLAAIPRTRQPNASNQWLAAMPGRTEYSNANGARRANLQGTDWQTSNMSNACGGCA
tara:strand:+ start:5107 stop:5658 length:552 start_codon:yes stop_codon:yes gene_type:complete